MKPGPKPDPSKPYSQYNPDRNTNWATSPKGAVSQSVYRRSEKGKATSKRAQIKYRQRDDRPCRYASKGCTEFSVVGSTSCREHLRLDNARKMRQRRHGLKFILAASQEWVCGWCHERLPEDLSGTEVDHVIPEALGGPSDEWNLQTIHWECNRGEGGKFMKLSPEAIALAELHGIDLVV